MRRFPSRRLAPACLAVATVFAMAGASAQTAAPAAGAPAGGKIKVGFMLPYTGTYAALGNAIENGFRMYVQQQGGKLGGREIEYFKVDDESDPAKAPENATKLVKRDQVDVVVGTVHSGVQMGIVKVAKENNTLLIIPNAGVDEATGPLCGPNIFRTSFSNWQPGYAMGQVLGERGLKKVVTLTWKYAAGEQSVKGFKEAFEAKGGKVVKELSLPFPNVEFQALITEVASLKPDAVFVFFAGGGAVKFVKDWAAAGLKDKIPLYGSGFLTDGTLEAQGNAAQGLETTLHYADGLSNARDKNFRLDYAKTYKLQPDVYAVQGYDAAQLLAAGATAVKGDMTRKADLYKAMGGARIDSPRGTFTLSKAHNPVQDFYLRKVDGRENKVSSVAVKALADPARGCRL
ncbi:putative ABC-type branched-chain amino acid transport systems, periplasmic component [Cupriavidus taiwanensis]|uniref:ABC-type branched-chain amino acid transport systems, periplasmic component n=1 Tax=Cupriavidus taiwanensis TaxID=164546 RepID=A0A976G0Q3_9BURK|nr:ABC transporter substrate-binding protein [Cupriavidus taiwanensis]SOZ15997.1 putative ABC-type branched-chain amino acid transport systems, periplasmic component [Cupriavidus taiwanensis]SOZ29108.1 putative ABC-type branched-chain amino acid transport systems, periplasmic component [Cupriavidus taiwanensis]SOZ46569.1 putative ABC-type branched-chain amino acid transport systems, periplasmic component [Cupriavidus taiwanensis]SOZ50317.1 putative ABC-type branched-chain amino acid transport s